MIYTIYNVLTGEICGHEYIAGDGIPGESEINKTYPGYYEAADYYFPEGSEDPAEYSEEIKSVKQLGPNKPWKRWCNRELRYVPRVSLEDLRDSVYAEIKHARDAEENGLFEWRGHILQADKERITGAATAAMIAKAGGLAYEDQWTLENNSVITINEDDAIEIGMALFAHVSACHAKARILRARIYQADFDELETISWS